MYNGNSNAACEERSTLLAGTGIGGPISINNATQKEMTALSAELEKALAEYAHLLERLRNIRATIVGHQPEKDCATPSTPSPTSFKEFFAFSIHNLTTLNNQLARELNQINVF